MRYQLSADEAAFYENTFVPALFGTWARRLIDAVRPAPGQSVLDVACGTGAVARLAADAVGPSGTVVGVDGNEGMLSVARTVRPDVRWELGDACALSYADGSFDLVLSQAGLMFFDDRAGALREMGRVAGPAGRVGVQVPGRLSRSPGYRALAEVIARHAGQEVSDLLNLYFSAGDPDDLTRWFAEAGLTISTFETWMGATVLGSIDTFLAVELLPIAARVDPAVHERIVADCRVALEGFVASGAVAAPLEVQLIIGKVVIPSG